MITIYEIDATGERNWAKAVYNFRWTPQTDPFGVVHKTIDYPGVPVDHSTIKENFGILKNVRIPIRPHFGVIGAGAEGGRHRRFHPARLFRRQHRQLAHRQGRHDVLPGRGAGRAAVGRRSARLAGRFRAVRHGDRMLADRHVPAHPAQEGDAGRHAARRGSTTRCWRPQDEWVVHGFSYPNYLAELGANAQADDLRQIVGRPRHARRLPQDARSFLMTTKGLTEDEAISLMSVAVDFGVTQVVDGNWGVHAIIKKSLFAGEA